MTSQLPRDLPERYGSPSRLLNYLPTLYADDPFLGQFLNIFCTIFSELCNDFLD